jgi:integrase
LGFRFDHILLEKVSGRHTERLRRLQDCKKRRILIAALDRTHMGSINAHALSNTRSDVSSLVTRMKKIPVTANRVLSCLRKMFNMAEVWGFRDDGTNPCRHIPKYPENGKTQLITDDEMVRLFSYLERADVEGLEHPFLTLAIRLQFGFAARMSEITSMEWGWVDFANRRVVWPDSKTGEISKPMSEDVVALLMNAPRLEGSPYVVPSIFRADRPMSAITYSRGWKRVLERAEVPHVGTHGIRHRATTEIANSGVPVKVGMQLTAHKTVTQFMRYVHTEDDPVRAAAETVASRRLVVLSGPRTGPQPRMVKKLSRRTASHTPIR